MQRAQYADLKIYLPNDPLVKVDRMSMAHSLEIRCPLLDHRLVELAFQHPDRPQDAERTSPSRCCDGLAERRLPQKVVNMPKRGFTAPVGAWLAGPYAERFRGDVLGAGIARRDIVDHRARRAALRRPSRRARRSFLRAVGGLDARALGRGQEPAAGLSRMLRTIFVIVALTAGWSFALQSPLYAAWPLPVDRVLPAGVVGVERHLHDAQPVVFRRRVPGDAHAFSPSDVPTRLCAAACCSCFSR